MIAGRCHLGRKHVVGVDEMVFPPLHGRVEFLRGAHQLEAQGDPVLALDIIQDGIPILGGAHGAALEKDAEFVGFGQGWAGGKGECQDKRQQEQRATARSREHDSPLG